MANILPFKEKENRVYKARTRVLFLVAAVLSITAVVMVLALLPAYIVLSAEQSAYQTQLTALQSAAEGGERADRDTLVRTQKRLQRLKERFAAPSFADFLARSVAASEGARITALSYSRSAEGGLVSLSGTVPDRDTLGMVRGTLETLEEVVDVAIPVQSLLGNQSDVFEVRIRTSF